MYSPDQEEGVLQTEETQPEVALGQAGVGQWRKEKKGLAAKASQQQRAVSGKVSQAGGAWQPRAGPWCSS